MRKKAAVEGLQALKEIKVLQKCELPPLPEVEDADAVHERADQIRQRAKEVGDWVMKVLTYLAYVAGLGREERECLPLTTEIEEEVDRLLHQEPIRAWRRAAWRAVFHHYFGQTLQKSEQVKKLFSFLVKKGYLATSRAEGNGMTVYAYNTSYGVPPDSCFEEPEVNELQVLVEKFVRATTEQEQATWQNQQKGVLARGELSWREFLDGKNGLFAVRIPAEKVLDHHGEVVGWRSGGTLLVESRAGRIYPIEAVGKIEPAIQEMKELGAYLFLSSLAYSKPPYVERLTEAQARKVQLLWYLLKRGTTAEQEKEETLRLRKEMEEKATITPQGFFDEEEGICFLSFEGPWYQQENGHSIREVFFLVERVGNGLRLLEIPPHLKEFLSKCLDKTFEEDGVPQPLRAVFEAIRTQLSKADQIAEAEEAEETDEPTA